MVIRVTPVFREIPDQAVAEPMPARRVGAEYLVITGRVIPGAVVVAVVLATPATPLQL